MTSKSSRCSGSSVGIVGAGVMGRVLAWQLAQAGFSVTLFDKDPIGHGEAAAYTAAGMLAPYCEVESAELRVFELGMTSIELWQRIAKQLPEDIGFHQRGSIVVSHREDRPDFDVFHRQLKQKLNPTPDQVRSLNRDQLLELEPELAERFNEALYLPEEAWVCPQKCMTVLASVLIELGVQWFAESPVEVVEANIVRTEERTQHFDWVIDCRGLGAKPQWPELRGVRGEVIVLQAPDVSFAHLVRLMHPRYRLYLVPKGYDDLFAIGATQIESQDQGRVTVRSAMELLSAAYSLHSGFSEARIITLRANCRPALKDNLPKVDVQPGLIRINGLYRHGFLLAPVLGEQVKAIVSE